MVITELDCDQNDWPEMRLLRDNESKMRCVIHRIQYSTTCSRDKTFTIIVRYKILMVENIDEFDEFSAICQYFPYQNFPFS